MKLKKKKSLIIFILLLICSFLFLFLKKNSEKEIKVEFDKNLYLSAGYGIFLLDETEKVINSEEIAKQFNNGEYETASKLLQSLLNQSKVNEMPAQKLEIINALAIIKTFEGKLDEARQLYDEAQEILDSNVELYNKCISAKVYNNLSLFYYVNFEREKAQEYLTKTLENPMLIQDPLAEMVVNFNLMVVESGMDNPMGAPRYDYLDKAKNMLNSEKKLLGSNQFIGAQVYIFLGDSYISIYNNKKAKECYDKAEQIIERGGEWYTIIWFRMQISLGVLYVNEKDYTGALYECEKALDIAEPLLGEENFIVANLNRNIGGIYLHMDEDWQGIEYSIKALKGYKNNASRCGLWGNIATAYTSLEEYDLAKEYAFKSYKVSLDSKYESEEKYKLLLKYIYNGINPSEDFEVWIEEEVAKIED